MDRLSLLEHFYGCYTSGLFITVLRFGVWIFCEVFLGMNERLLDSATCSEILFGIYLMQLKGLGSIFQNNNDPRCFY